MKVLFLAGAVFASSTVAASAATLSGSTGYLLARNGQSIRIMDDMGLPSVTYDINLTYNSARARIEAIAYRPLTGQIFGYQIATATDTANRVFEVDVTTGQLTDTGVTFDPGANAMKHGTRIGFDFNNKLDAARVVSLEDDNLVFSPSDNGSASAGTVIQATDLDYAAGDVNEKTGKNPDVFANAYTNAVDGEIATTTQQYAVDARTNSLVTLDNNTGIMNTVGSLGIEVTHRGGLEILSDSQGDNLGVAVFTLTGGNTGMYTIDLTTGAASLYADLGPRDFAASFAARTGSTLSLPQVPLPASAVLLLAGLGGLGAMKRRKA